MKSLLRVSHYCLRYPFFAVGTLLCAVISTLAGLAYPKLVGEIVDEVIGRGDVESLGSMVGLLAGAFLLRDLFNSLRIRLNNIFEQHVVLDLRRELYGVMQRLPVTWFDHNTSGDLMTRVSEDVTNMERVLIDGIEQGVVALLQVAVITAVLFYLHTVLAFWALLPMPFLLAGAIWFTTTSYRRHKPLRRAVSEMNSLIVDNMQGIRQIKSFAREEQSAEHFERMADDVRHKTLSVMHAWATYSPSMEFLASMGMVLVLYFGGLEVIRNPDFQIGDLVTYLGYLAMFYEPVRRLHQLNQIAQAGRAAADRVFAIVDEALETEPAEPVNLPPRSQPGREVRYDDVHFAYRKDLSVLKGISITARAGQTIALVGPTGSGKTTLVNMLPRFYPHGDGSITIDGVPIESLTLRELREEVGVVTQEPFLFNATVRENLLVGSPTATEDDLERVLQASNALDFVKALPDHLDTHVGERGVRLSVGEKQRLSIARTLLKDPPVLILDEATASVDTATEQLIQQALERLLASRTSFVIAHRLSTVRNADEICVLRHGEIIERGAHDELVAMGGLYAHLCSAQNSGTIEQTLSRDKG